MKRTQIITVLGTTFNLVVPLGKSLTIENLVCVCGDPNDSQDVLIRIYDNNVLVDQFCLYVGTHVGPLRFSSEKGTLKFEVAPNTGQCILLGVDII